MTPRKALGRGLDALIPAGTQPGQGELVYLEIDRIKTSHLQPRKSFDQKSIQELADSIKEQGLLQPILVRKIDAETFELIAGERRLRAAKLAGITKMPAIVKDVKDSDALALSLLENLQREDLNPIEEAKGYFQLIKEFHFTQDELARKLGKDRSTIANALRLLKLPEEIQAEMEKGKITPGHGRALLSLDSAGKIKILFRKIVDEGLNVRQAEAIAKKLTEPEKTRQKPVKSGTDSKIFLEEIERNLMKAVSAKVRLVETGNNRGKIEIYYNSFEELERIIELVQRKK